MMRRLVVATLMFSMVFLCLPMTGGSQGATADQYLQYGNKLYQAKDYANAAKYYQAAVQLNPNSAQTYQVLGNCFLLSNRKAEAVAAYEKALTLNPNNPQLAAYIQSLKNQLGATAPAAAQTAPAAAAPASANQGMQYLSQGGTLFQQKQYAAAIPYFQQAAQLMPTDYRASYYLAYSQYMNRDMKNAAVNFYLANQKQPNATLKAYADRIKASLPPADQQWVDAQAAGPSTATVGMHGRKAKPKQFGVRVLSGIALASLKDFNDEADFQTSYATKQGYGLVGQVPKGNIWIGGEPFYQPIPAVEVAVGFGVFPVGSYSYSASGWTAITGGAPGYGTPSSEYSSYPGATTDIIRNEFKITTDQASLTARFYAGGTKAKGFLGVGLGVYPASITWSRTIASGLGDPTVDDSYSGTFKKTGIGEHVMLGGSFRLGSNVSLEPYVMYRMAKISGLTGAIADNSGAGTSGTLTVYSGPNGEKVIAVDEGKTTLPTGWTSKALELDLSGIQAGLGISVSF